MSRSARARKKKANEAETEMVEFIKGQPLKTRNGSKEERVLTEKQKHELHRHDVYLLHEKVYEMDLFRQHFYEHNKKFVETIKKDYTSIESFQATQQIEKAMELILERHIEVDDYIKCQALDVKTAIKALRNVWTANKQINPNEISHLGQLFQLLSKFEYLRSKQLQKEEEEDKGTPESGLKTKIVEPKKNKAVVDEEGADTLKMIKKKYTVAYKRFNTLCDYISMQDGLILECIDLVEGAPIAMPTLSPRTIQDASDSSHAAGNTAMDTGSQLAKIESANVICQLQKKSVVKFNLDLSNDESPQKSREHGMHQSRPGSTSPVQASLGPVKSKPRLKKLPSGIQRKVSTTKSKPNLTSATSIHSRESTLIKKKVSTIRCKPNLTETKSRDCESFSSPKEILSKPLPSSARKFTKDIPNNLISSKSNQDGIAGSRSSKIPVRISTVISDRVISPKDSTEPICRPLSSPALEFHQIHNKEFLNKTRRSLLEISPSNANATKNELMNETPGHDASYIPFLPIFKGPATCQTIGISKLKPIVNQQTDSQLETDSLKPSDTSVEDSQTDRNPKKVFMEKMPRYESIHSSGYGSSLPKQRPVLPKIPHTGNTENQLEEPAYNHAPLRGILKQSKISKDVLQLSDPTVRPRRASTVHRQVIQPNIVSMAPPTHSYQPNKKLTKLPQIPRRLKGVAIGTPPKIPHPPSDPKPKRQGSNHRRDSHIQASNTRLGPIQSSTISRGSLHPSVRPKGFHPPTQSDPQRFGALKDGFQHNITYFHNPRNFQ